MPGNITILRLVSRGLTGLAALVVIAFCFVCDDTVASFLEKPFGPVGNPYSSASPLINPRTADPRFEGRSDRQQQTVEDTLLSTASLLDKKDRYAACSVRIRNHNAPAKDFHG
jgi:hypothetical protein